MFRRILFETECTGYYQIANDVYEQIYIHKKIVTCLSSKKPNGPVPVIVLLSTITESLFIDERTVTIALYYDIIYFFVCVC